MVDWKSSMTQSFEYYIVDPGTWTNKERLNNVISCTINRDYESETLGSATIDIYGKELDTECYIRAYLITIQKGVQEKHPLGTFLVQSPSNKFNGHKNSVSVDAYTPLMELKDSRPPLGYYVPKNENIMDYAYRLTREHVKAPVVEAKRDITLYNDYVSSLDDNWMSFITDLMSNARYKFSLDEMGRILFEPEQASISLRPVWTYDDDNSSILYPEISVDKDLYGIPNAVEVIYSHDKGFLYSKIVNDSMYSPTSTVNRGRETLYRDTSPSIVGTPTQELVDQYASNLLYKLSTQECIISYTHGYCPTRIGDCVRLNYERAKLNGITAKVIRQSIKCEPGCPVVETAVYTENMWG